MTCLVKELLELAEFGAEGPAHAFAGVEHHRRLRDREGKARDGFDKIALFVVNHQRAALIAVAIELLVNEKQLVHRIDRNARAACALRRIPGAWKLNGRDTGLFVEI